VALVVVPFVAVKRGNVLLFVVDVAVKKEPFISEDHADCSGWRMLLVKSQLTGVASTSVGIRTIMSSNVFKIFLI